MKHSLAAWLNPAGGLSGLCAQQREGPFMAIGAKREDEIFRMVAGAMMVLAILFGVLELADVIRI
jgi:hypothetical protein